MAAEVITALALDKFSVNGTFITLTETKDAKSDFLISSILSERCKKNSGILLITFQNTYRHYFNIGMKLGYNLDKLREVNKLFIIEPFKDIYHTLGDETTNEINFLDSNKRNIILNLINKIKFELEKLFTKSNEVCLIIEDVSHFLDLDIPIKDIFCFKQNLVQLLHQNLNLSIVVSVAITNTADDLIVANCFRHVGNTVVEVSGLNTGKSKLVNGVMKINRFSNNLDSWSVQNVYHYRLHDRYIKLFAPGNAPI